MIPVLPAAVLRGLKSISVTYGTGATIKAHLHVMDVTVFNDTHAELQTTGGRVIRLHNGVAHLLHLNGPSSPPVPLCAADATCAALSVSADVFAEAQIKVQLALKSIGASGCGWLHGSSLCWFTRPP